MKTEPIGTVEMVEATSTTNGDLIITRTNINPENIISSTTQDDTKKSNAVKEESSSLNASKNSPTEADESLNLSVEILKIEDKKHEVASVSVPTDSVNMDIGEKKDQAASVSVPTDSVNMDIGEKKDQAASVSVPTDSVNMDIGEKKKEVASVLKPVENLIVDEVEDVKFKNERKSVPVLEAIKQPSSDDSTESLQAFKL